MGPTQVKFCENVMTELRACILAARPGSPLRVAFDGLRDDFFDVACAAVSRHTAEHLRDHEFLYLVVRSEERLLPSVQATVITIVAATVRDCIRAWERTQAVAS